MVIQKTPVATTRPKAMMLHGVLALVITSDTQTIISPWACQLIVLETNPLKVMTDIAIHAIVIALILVVTLMIDMIAEHTIASQLLVTAKAKTTMRNIAANLDQCQGHNHGPILVILEVQDMIMVITFIMMTPGEGNSHNHPLPSLA